MESPSSPPADSPAAGTEPPAARAEPPKARAAPAKAPAFDFGKLQRGEFIGFFGIGVLFFSLFLKWFATDPDNANAQINGHHHVSYNAFGVYSTLDWLLVAACSAPLILAWIIIRGHTLTWRPGEVTMIVGMVAFALIILNGVILGRPGEPDSAINFKIGYLVGVLGSLLICAGGFIRQAEGERARKPPGVI
jgi:hypothetical protein